MQATPPLPRSHFLLYEESIQEAKFAESVGIDSIWISEHHLWFDGYCPAPLTASAHVLGATHSLRVGTSILLLPLYEPKDLAARVKELDSLSGGRFSLGVGAGYRSEEFEAFGVDRSQRGKLMDSHLEVLRTELDPQTDLWVGATGPKAIGRAARFEAGLLLPPPVPIGNLREKIETYRAAGGSQVGIMRDVWIADETADAVTESQPWIRYAHSQYASMEGLREVDDITRFVAGAQACSIIGDPERVVESLLPVIDLDPDVLLFRIRWADQPTDRVRRCIDLLANRVVPLLRKIAP